MISERQEKILNFLVQEYIKSAEPVSSKLLKKSGNLNVSEATIRNELQDLTKLGFIEQPHTSAGRVPTQKAYRYIAIIIEKDEESQLEDFIARQVTHAHQEMEQQIKMMEKLMDTLENDNISDALMILDEWHKKMFENL